MFYFSRFCKCFWHGQSWHSSRKIKILWHSWLTTTLVKSYLPGRYQLVKINNAKSDNKAIIFGVPQGSVLGPLLFLIYINDMYKSAPKVCFHLFPNDTYLFYSNKSYKKMEIEIKGTLMQTWKSFCMFLFI